MEEIKQTANNHRRKFIALAVFSVVGIIGIITVYFYMQYKSTHIITDDAFVVGRVHTIASKVPGTLKGVYITDNQFVKKGDLIAEIDMADYDVRVKEAESAMNAERSKLAEVLARIEVEKKQLSETNYKVMSAKANLEVQEANLKQAVMDIKRAENLFRKDAISKERYEKTKTGHDVTVAMVKAAGDQLRQSEASLETQNAIIRQAESSLQSQTSVAKQKEAVLRAAELKRDYSKIYAPADGYVTKKSVEVGNQIDVGQPLMAVVPLDDIWVIANYKETQLGKVKQGQKVEIKVDTYSGKKFYGKIDSIMAGTGSAFSLFPSENATGNFVKVVQRIPVKIVLDKNTDPSHVLRVGMSVEPTIIVEK